MNATQLRMTLLALSLSLVALTVDAVTPPAPDAWFSERLKMEIPEGLKAGLPAIPSQIAEDLAMAAAARPRNSDNLLLILVEFPDHPADQIAHPASAFEDMMFSFGTVSTGSLAEYYTEISYGEFTPAGTVTVWIMAPQPYSYYSDGNYGMGSYPNNSQGLLNDCVELLDPVLDFSAFDNSGDGYAEGIFLVHAGPGAEETGNANDIWSHAWYYSVETDDGVYTGRYSIEPEEHMDESLIRIGVFCHEYGHVLGLPDLYDYDGSSEGVGVYCLMSGGSWGALPGNPERPTFMCAEMRRELGWLTPIELTGSEEGLTIPPVETNAVCYRITHPTNPDEYYLLEYRAKIGFDSLFRGEGGLAIWHIDVWGDQTDEEHRYVTLEQADGSFDLERDFGTGNRHPRTNRGDAGDLFPGAAGNDRFSYATMPDNLAYDGFTELMTITNIEQSPEFITLDIYITPSRPLFSLAMIEIDDDNSPGFTNRNGAADSGEVVDLILTLDVEGTAPTSLTGMITTSDPRVTLIDNTTTFGAATHGQAVSNEGSSFQIEVLSGNADSAVTLSLSLNADETPVTLPLRLNINRQPVLVVLDNNGSHWSDELIEAAHRSGTSVDVLNTTAGTIDYEDLIPYHAVLWTTGSYFGTRTSSPDYTSCLSEAEIAVLEEYLDAGGRLGLFSQDYLYDRGLDGFAGDYLMLNDYEGDQSCTEIVGQTGGPFSGLSGYAPEWTYYDYTDFLTPATGAAPSLLTGTGLEPVMIHNPASFPTAGEPAATFCTYGIERLDSASLAGLLDDWLAWILSNTNVDVPLPISPKDGELVGSATPVLKWTESVGAAEYGVQLAVSEDFLSPILDSTLAGTEVQLAGPLADGSYYWRVNANGATATPFSPIAAFVYELAYVCGDADGGGTGPDIVDLVYLVTYMFQDGPPPPEMRTVDVNGDGTPFPDIADLVYLVTYMFQDGPGLICP